MSKLGVSRMGVGGDAGPMPDRLVTDWTDVNNAFLRTAWYIDTGADPAPLLGAIAAAQNASYTVYVNGPATFGAGVPSDALFPSVLDLAVLNFTTSAGTEVQVQVPAPVGSDFTPGARLVNPSDANVAAVIAAVIGTVCDNLGNLATAYVSGFYSSRRKEQS